jgi:hypothetical protein
MHIFNSAIRPDRFEAIAVERATSAVSEPTAAPPAFLAMPYWTTDETADYLRCESQTIRKALSQQGSFHGLKPRRVGRRWYFSAANVRALIEGA